MGEQENEDVVLYDEAQYSIKEKRSRQLLQCQGVLIVLVWLMQGVGNYCSARESLLLLLG